MGPQPAARARRWTTIGDNNKLKMANLRRELMDELLTTERQYVRDLHILIEVPLSLSRALLRRRPSISRCRNSRSIHSLRVCECMSVVASVTHHEDAYLPSANQCIEYQDIYGADAATRDHHAPTGGSPVLEPHLLDPHQHQHARRTCNLDAALSLSLSLSRSLCALSGIRF